MKSTRARLFRREMTPPERRLWLRLRKLRERGFHIRRQAPFSAYFLDFVCFDRRVVVEVDGQQHADPVQCEHDAVRDAVLKREGFVVLRFCARDVLRDTNTVMERIVLELESAPSFRGKALNPEFPTLAASQPVPPHEGEG